MAFVIRGDRTDRDFKKLPISSLTVTVGEMLTLAVGATTWTEATSSTPHWQRKAIAKEAASTSATSVLCYELTGDEKVEALVTNTASANHNGDRMVLTDSNTVNNTGTDSTAEAACFIQEKVGKDTTHVIGRIVVGTGVDPDAT